MNAEARCVQDITMCLCECRKRQTTNAKRQCSHDSGIVFLPERRYVDSLSVELTYARKDTRKEQIL
jgi:hypothetical protein